jgi:TrmH family RNA methyltransferase
MITIKKLKSLKPETRQRKYVRILQDLERDVRNSGNEFHPVYIEDFFALLHEDIGVVPDAMTVRAIQNLRYQLQRMLGIETGDWDMILEGTEYSPKLQYSIFLEDVRSPFNLGSIARTAMAFGFKELLLSPDCCPADHPRALRSSMGALEHLSVRTAVLTDLDPQKCYALESGGLEIQNVQFEKEGCLLLGNEELGLSQEALKYAGRGTVGIVMSGYKASLNVGVAFGIAAHAVYSSVLS